MADYYRQASFVIPTEDEDQTKWLISVFDGAGALFADLSKEPESCLPDEAVTVATEHGFDFVYADLPDWRVHPDGVWVSSDNLDIEFMEIVIQAYLRKFHPNKFFGFEYAMTCSKPRLGGFGGGAVYVDAKEVSYDGSYSWLSYQYAKASAGGGELLEGSCWR